MLGNALFKSKIKSQFQKKFVHSLDQIKTIGVAGSGQMGTGITYVFSKYD
jgi:hypothetical protein